MSNLSQFFSGGQKIQIFTSSGTFTPSKPNTQISVLVIGGGKGGNGGGNGGTSSFGALASATGGTVSCGSGDGPAVGYTGVFGFGSGGSGQNSYAGVNSGGSGDCGASTSYYGVVSAAQTVTVGAGGSAGTGAQAGKPGVVIVWFE